MKTFKEFLNEASPEANTVPKNLFKKNVNNLAKGEAKLLFSIHHAGKDYHIKNVHDMEGNPEQIQIHHEGKPVGYMDSKIDEKRKKFKEGNTALHKEHQGTGLMGAVYHHFVKNGYTIHSHDSHSTGMSKTWDRLGKQPDVALSTDEHGLVAKGK